MDASAVVAALVDASPVGQWAADLVETHPLAAPALMPVEAANILRRSALAGAIPAGLASEAHADLLDVRVDLHHYESLGRRSGSSART